VVRTVFLAAAAATLSASPVRAQAWLPAAGQGAVAVVFQHIAISRHLQADGTTLHLGEIDSHNMMIDVTYGLSDKVAIGVGAPYISTEYTGDQPHPHSQLDGGYRHGMLQDFRTSVRYSLITGRTAVTPFAGVIIPSHRYDYYGHAAGGRRLAELQLGLSAGRVMSSVLPGLFVQGRYSYGFTQRPLGRYHDRSNFDAEIGYFITSRFRIFGLTTAEYTHGGLPLMQGTALTSAELLHHDQISRTRFIDVGGGGQFSVTRRLDVFGSFMRTTLGYSAHAIDRGISVGVSWGLGKSGPADPLQERSHHALPKCLCEKGTPP